MPASRHPASPRLAFHCGRCGRRAQLARILLRTSIADRHLIDSGDLRTCKIHLGITHVFIATNAAYLRIVRGGRVRGTVFLPF
jgi:hypothetical protein